MGPLDGPQCTITTGCHVEWPRDCACQSFLPARVRNGRSSKDYKAKTMFNWHAPQLVPAPGISPNLPLLLPQARFLGPLSQVGRTEYSALR